MTGGQLFATPRYAPLEDKTIVLTIPVEKWRFLAYFFFWTMVFLARYFAKNYVEPILEAGLDPSTTPIERMGCGPFNRENSKFGFGFGDGFDLKTSHLSELFGYANVCVNWDYTPSREYTGAYFPLFEYSLIFYLFLDIVNSNLSYRRGELPKWFWNLSLVIGIVSIILCVEFRMIFIILAYENVAGHTIGFLGLQIALILVAYQNVTYIIMTGQSYPGLGLTQKRTFIVAITYLVLQLGISAIKITSTTFVVQNGKAADWTLKYTIFPGVVVGELIDILWMIFNAFIPPVIAVVRACFEKPLKIYITSPTPEYDGEVEGERNSPYPGERDSLIS